MDTGTLGDIDDNVDVRVVVVVRASGNLDVLVRHPDVVGVDLEILRRGHDDEFDGALRTERLVSPFSDRTDFFYSSDT